MGKRRRGAKAAAYISAVVLCTALLTPAFASEVEELQQQIDELDRTQQQLQQEMESTQQGSASIENALENTEDQVSELKKQKTQLEANMKELDTQLGTAVKELADITGAQEAKQQEIDAAGELLADAQKSEEKQYENMKLRIRYMYEQGSGSYLAVLLAAADAGDLLSRAEYITNIYKYDRDMLKQYREAKDTVSEQKTALTKQYEELEQLKAQADEKKAGVETLLAQKNAELAQYNETIASTQALADEYQQQLNARETLIAQLEAAANSAAQQQDAAIAALTQTLNQLQNQERDAAEYDAAQAVLARMAQEAQAELEAAGGAGLTVDPNTLFVWPCPSSSRITSDYGYRIHPIYGDLRLHNGIDVGADMGASIIAAYRGTVIGAGYDPSMGNYVMIDHGEGVVTIYMHASYLCVSAGDQVETGQLIALVGATGDATGPHLHFTVRLNGNYVNPWNYVSSN